MSSFPRRFPRWFRMSVRGQHSKPHGWTLATGSNIKTVPMSSSVSKTCELMRDNQVGAVMVMDESNIAGIFTDRDVVNCVAKDGEGEEPVGKYMTSFEKLVTATAQSNVNDLMVMILEHNVRHIPLVDKDRKQMLRMISIKDVVNSSIKDLNQEVHNLRWFMAR